MRLQYRSDQFSVAKLAPKLSYKSCWPSNIERQNVKLALRIFDDTNVAALTIHQSTKYIIHKTKTSDFIALICRIWKIFNVNTPWKGVRLNDPDSLPLVHNDPRFNLMSTLVRWLEYWRSIPVTQGKLTAQTFTSFHHSSIALPKLVEYLTGECGFSYVLSSFIQNDPIEHHFGLYRQMSGSNYNVRFVKSWKMRGPLNCLMFLSYIIGKIMSLKIEVLLWNLSAPSKPMKMIFIAAILRILIPHIICLAHF